MTAYYKIHPIPPQKFFIASDDYAARAGLIHLIDPEGVKEAAARLKIARMDTGEDTTADASGEPTDSKKEKGAHKKVATAPVAENNVPIRDAVPAGGVEPVTAPSGGGADPDKQKFDRWKNTLDNVEKHLNNE